MEYAGQLRAVAVDNGAGCVAPSQTTIADGSYQPLSRPIFMYVRADALDRPELRAFVTFYLINGAALAREARYIPLPERAYPLVARRFEQRTTGSVFSGGAQVGLSIEHILQLEGGQYSNPIRVIESGGLTSPALDRRSLPSQARPGRAGGLRTP